MTDAESESEKRQKAQRDALVEFRELRARVELNENGEAVALDLLDSPILDAHLEQLNALSSLESLFLSGLTRISDEGLKYLVGLTNLKVLDISGSASNPNRRNITDAGLQNLNGLTKLEKLNLNRTQITNAGVAHLNRLSNLKTLSLHGTQVTADGVDKLKRSLPSCQIEL